MDQKLKMQEGKGGAKIAPPVQFVALSGSESQVEWAQRIRLAVMNEFDRVAASFRSVAQKQPASKRADTEAIIAILEEKRAEVMNQERSGYFIRDWQEIDDQIRRMISEDPRFKQIRAKSE